MKKFFENKANQKVFKSVWWFIKYVMVTAFVVNYFNILYGGFLWLLFVVLASICNANMDVITHHFERSIYKNKKRLFFNPQYSWMNKYERVGDMGVDSSKRKKLFWIINFPVQLTDLWHLSKTIMIISLGLSVVLYTPSNAWYLDLFLFGYFWNITFSIFYYKIFR